jgi:hypothetical protein
MGFLVPQDIYERNDTASFKRFDENVLDLINVYLEKMPKDLATVLALHHLSPFSPSAIMPETGESDSSWPLHCGHTMIGFIGSVLDQSKLAE